jgi:DNA-directed RNA polymerase subunit M/transcription elongation factor TFIIS
MPIEFCKKCGGMIRIQDIGKGKSYKFCDKCQDFEVVDTNKNSGISFSESIKKEENKGRGIKNGVNELATYKHTCKKCGYDKAQVIDVGILYSDEDNLILLKCGKCGFSERIGRKTT